MHQKILCWITMTKKKIHCNKNRIQKCNQFKILNSLSRISIQKNKIHFNECALENFACFPITSFASLRWAWAPREKRVHYFKFTNSEISFKKIGFGTFRITPAKFLRTFTSSEILTILKHFGWYFSDSERMKVLINVIKLRPWMILSCLPPPNYIIKVT